MSTDFHVIIPARYQSTRLPGKLLMDLHGMSVIERVYRQALKAQPKSITIATDHEMIYTAAQHFGADVIMTASTHQSGTDRIAEAVVKKNFRPDDIVVNVQGDEPLIAPELIRQVAQSLKTTAASVATLCWPVHDYTLAADPNVVKVVRDKNQHALYFSRSLIPANRDEPLACKHVFRHIGLYAYRVAFLLEMSKWPVCDLEAMEALEQLRVLWAGHQIKVEEACVLPLQDINTAEDLQRARMNLAPLPN
ncbi:MULTISPECIES: 3-deoxy-manno-octulosonate cytidylyltransferase [Legionella]|uniref:3-deoxy-manno-octulosonate cytidylyltransferase n=1 Tax=Legionella septentrionalis TaxID=2498109 RepID=A0A433JKH3_9GAMM|nr:MULTISPECIES: 3-deoxy-manno-octulosonate cytidylyltransferase [Legionella]MCP0914162.1 3-deoxy-manno-octulosonate cytidylyltransferase [Legionella sp. 27cVA30]RUQ89257.1 3-deoxy-manno-octulosonate cytidylyltransferase [Legionella septentrionalis]RUQ94334.1 3-deoxy-manno-octulosonate cytidylyltransferase [Legionella septentrionalis]RUR11708.1 3-deoxy-manno-octulosonate cytidylyltransferase [Legionella septentrionalis]RUR17396.1 3-deoxy-manno-octulosonate cytidylyltransferase [Legionella sept